MRAGTVVAVVLTAFVTAAVTSAVWLAIFNLREDEGTPASDATASRAPVSPARLRPAPDLTTRSD